MSHLRSLETADTKVREIDFVALKAEATAPAPTSTPSKGENPIQIAIGAKKDEDFSVWYTDVNLHWNRVYDSA